MKLQTVPARQGASWVRNGFRVFFKRPMAFTALFTVFLFAAFLLQVVPLIGPVLFLVALPLVSAGFMIATQQVLQERQPLPGVFLEPLRIDAARRKAMIQLGLAHAVGTFAIMWLCNQVDSGKLQALQQMRMDETTDSQAMVALMMDPQFQWDILLRFGLLSLLSLPFWHAPAITHWGGQSWGKAIFFSSVACWRNKAAFAVYGVTWVGVILLFSVMAQLVFSLLGNPRLIVLAAVPASLMFWTVFYASLFFTFADCFAQDPPPEPLETLES
jgi:hypothetical protein